MKSYEIQLQYNKKYEPLFSDTDECSITPDVCIGADDCENTMGGYKCLCHTGLSWNGTVCEGDTTHSCQHACH